MARTLGPGDNVGKAQLGWRGEETYMPPVYYLSFGQTGDLGATIAWSESRGKWEFSIYDGDNLKIYGVDLFMDDKGTSSRQVLDEGTTELLGWMLTDGTGRADNPVRKKSVSQVKNKLLR